jgi:type IV secretory pathway TrbL component
VRWFRLSGFETTALGIMALALALIARHVLGVELGYEILALIGVILVPIGLWRMIVRGE